MIVFDLDGTLLDCRARQVALAAALSAARGRALDDAAFWIAKREGASTHEALALQGFEPAMALALAQDWTDRIEDDDWLRRDVAFPEVVAALRRAAAEGPTMILTARRDETALKRQLAALSLPRATEIVRVAPAAAAAAKAVVLSQRAARLFIGDTESDLRAAAEAAVPFWAVGWGQRSPAFLRAAGATVIIEHPDTLASRLEAFPVPHEPKPAHSGS